MHIEANWGHTILGSDKKKIYFLLLQKRAKESIKNEKKKNEKSDKREVYCDRKCEKLIEKKKNYIYTSTYTEEKKSNKKKKTQNISSNSINTYKKVPISGYKIVHLLKNWCVCDFFFVFFHTSSSIKRIEIWSKKSKSHLEWIVGGEDGDF